MKKDRMCPMTPYPIYQQQMMPQMMPPGIIMNDNQTENQIDKQIKNLENRITKLENTVYNNFNSTNYSNGNYHIV